MGKALRMGKPPIPPRKRLAENLKALMEVQGLSSPQVAEAAKIGRKTMNNFLNGRFDPRLGVVEKVANVFGLTTWQLLAADLAAKPPDSKQVLRLLEHYSSAPEDGRQTIMQVAEIAARKAAD
jgi:transcriptional regulator with XRE-family HTH domain